MKQTQNFNDRLNNFSMKKKILLMSLLLVIFGSLAYLVIINGNYDVEYSKDNTFCVETFKNYKLVNSPCPQHFKTDSTTQELGEDSWEYLKNNWTISNRS